jgi:hypothetical protein
MEFSGRDNEVELLGSTQPVAKVRLNPSPEW